MLLNASLEFASPSILPGKHPYQQVYSDKHQAKKRIGVMGQDESGSNKSERDKGFSTGNPPIEILFNDQENQGIKKKYKRKMKVPLVQHDINSMEYQGISQRSDQRRQFITRCLPKKVEHDKYRADMRRPQDKLSGEINILKDKMENSDHNEQQGCIKLQ